MLHNGIKLHVKSAHLTWQHFAQVAFWQIQNAMLITISPVYISNDKKKRRRKRMKQARKGRKASHAVISAALGLACAANPRFEEP